MDKVIRKKVMATLEPRANEIWNMVRNWGWDTADFFEVQEVINEVLTEIHNNALEIAAGEADTGGDFDTANAIRTYKLDKVEILYG